MSVVALHPEHPSLVHYDAFRRELAMCVSIDEALGIQDKAAQRAAYARMINDTEAEAQLRDIQIRANERFGELSRELERAQGARSDREPLPSDGPKSKAETLRDLGVSHGAAQRAEALAGGSTTEGQRVAKAALHGYLDTARNAGDVPSLKQARAIVREAVRSVVPPPSRERSRPFRFQPHYDAWLHWCGLIRELAEFSEADFDQMRVVAHSVGALDDNVTEARTTSRRLDKWLTTLEDDDGD